MHSANRNVDHKGSLFAAALFSLFLVSNASAQECWFGTVPGGALPTERSPVFCRIENTGPDTSLASPNKWFDDFNHGAMLADWSGTNYQVFERVDGVFDTIHWRDANHWMVDIAPVAPGSSDTATGGAMLRPDQTFEFENGKLVIETKYAAGHQDYIGLQAWGEIIITTSPIPGPYRVGGVYGYDMFPGHYTLGFRMQADGTSIASLVDNSANAAPSGRIWEMSFFQQVGKTNFGGFIDAPDVGLFRTCAADGVTDSKCRDRFRLVLTPTSLRVDVNNKRYFEQTGIPPLPDDLVNGPVYVYLASMVGTTDHDVVRFHWDRFRVNPCANDLNGDNFVNFLDLAQFANSFGQCIGCVADLDGNGVVNFLDLSMLTSTWGQCEQVE